MEWKKITTGTRCNFVMNARQVLWSREIPRDIGLRCGLLTRYLAVDSGRECFRRCEIHYQRDLLEERFMEELMDAKMFIIPYVELMTPVSPQI